MPTSVVTGATSGIGKYVALGLARAGHRVVIVGRDSARGDAARAWIAAQCPSAITEFVTADLALLRETRSAASTIMARHAAIHVLVNNAGVFCARREETAEGHERVIATNHLSPFVLTQALLPALQAATGQGTGARIVNTGSSTADRAEIDLNDLEGRRRWGLVHAYGQSKLALTMATLAWAKRLRDTGIVANVVHPGRVDTSLVRAGGPVGWGWRVFSRFSLTPEQGADSLLYAALSAEAGNFTGAYIKRRRSVPPNRLATHDDLVEHLWRTTEALTAS